MLANPYSYMKKKLFSKIFYTYFALK